MHVAADAEITPILFLNSAYVGVSTLLTEFTVLIAAAIAAHPRCIFCYNQNLYIFLLKNKCLFSSSFAILLVSTSADTSYMPISFVAIAFTI